MEIRWLAAFADIPDGRVGAARRFWVAVTATSASAPHGDRGQRVPLAANGEDPYLWVQQVHRGGGEAGWHLDVLVDEAGRAARQAVSLGASVVSQASGLVTLRSPGGMPFCLVAWEGEERRAEPRRWPGGYRSLLDQVCLDLPSATYEEESRFWKELTGWEPGPSTMPEFEHLIRPAPAPLRLLLQRLGDADAGPVRAHVDFSSDDVEAERWRHELLGARMVRVAEHWTTLRDPVGLEYCITDRDPLGSRS
jgi:hypothetical protein